MNKWIVIIALAVIAAGAAISFDIERQARTKSRVREDSLSRQGEQIAQLSNENQELSNLVATLNSSQSLSRDQLGELLKLRSEAGQLRRTVAEKEQLKTANARLQAGRAASERQLAEAQAAPNYWDRDRLTFAGFADPTSATRSFLWYMCGNSDGDWRALCTPEAMSELEREWNKRGKPEADRAQEARALATQLVSAAKGFRILDQQMTSPTETIVSVSFDGEGKTRRFVLRKVGNEWKFHDLLVAGQNRR